MSPVHFCTIDCYRLGHCVNSTPPTMWLTWPSRPQMPPVRFTFDEPQSRYIGRHREFNLGWRYRPQPASSLVPCGNPTPDSELCDGASGRLSGTDAAARQERKLPAGPTAEPSRLEREVNG